jgi:hypothetical protein
MSDLRHAERAAAPVRLCASPRQRRRLHGVGSRRLLRRRRLQLLIAAFAGAVAWTAHNLLSAALVSLACGWPIGIVLLHALTVGTLVVALAGAIVGGRCFAAATTDGTRFVGGSSVLLNALFALVIVAEGVPNFMLNPCWS